MEASRVNRLNPVIHERARLGIVAALSARDAVTFPELKTLLDMTDGNLSVHLRVLEEAGFVALEKSFVGRKPQTTARLTRKGKIAFEHYVQVLEEIVKGR